MKYLIIVATLMLFLLSGRSGSAAGASEIERLCEKAGFKSLSLNYRDGEGNLKKIRSSELGDSPFAKKYSSFFKSKKSFFRKRELLTHTADSINRGLIKKSKFRDEFLKYSSSKKRLSDPEGYTLAVADAVMSFAPDEGRKLVALMEMKKPKIAAFNFVPFPKDQVDGRFGAHTYVDGRKDDKYSLNIRFSNNESEPIPYLVSLIAHELEHAERAVWKIENSPKDLDSREITFYEEPLALKRQMKAYLNAIKKDPEIFCSWVYPSWYLGDILVPLSWVMAAIERDMKSGRLFLSYARDYSLDRSFFRPDQSDLSDEVKSKLKVLLQD